jgi:hypothetical protein
VRASFKKIASVLSHASLSEVERYTKATARKQLADHGMAKLIEGGW